MRLIDADKLDVVLRNEAKPFGYGVYECGITDGLALARECVETAPTIDAVPVVRCRECKMHENCYAEDVFAVARLDDNKRFCGVGQRREDGDA